MPSKKRIIFTCNNRTVNHPKSARALCEEYFRRFELGVVSNSATLKEIQTMLAETPYLLGLSVIRDKPHYRRSRRPYVRFLDRWRGKKIKFTPKKATGAVPLATASNSTPGRRITLPRPPITQDPPFGVSQATYYSYVTTSNGTSAFSTGAPTSNEPNSSTGS